MPGKSSAHEHPGDDEPEHGVHGSDGERAEQGQAEGGDGLGLADACQKAPGPELNAEESTAAKGNSTRRLR